MVWFPKDDEIVVTSDEVFLLSDDESKLSDMGLMSHTMSAFLCWCRILSSQHEISTEPGVVGGGYAVVETTPRSDFPSPPGETNGFVSSSDSLETAVTSTIAKEAEKQIFNCNLVPSHLHHMVSAFRAVSQRDFHNGYVLAATAMESYASQFLHRLYEKKRLQPNDPTMRFIEVVENKQKISHKDPIWAWLDDNRTEFKRLVHEKPLYLGHGSLMVENPQLYQNALKLYKTRNDLVHEGRWTSSSHEHRYLPNLDDGLAALNCALDVMSWFEPHSLKPPMKICAMVPAKMAWWNLHGEEAPNNE